MIAKRANAYKQSEQWEDAAADWTRVLEWKPDDIGYLNQHAEAYGWSLRQYDKALPDWSWRVELEPKTPGS